MLGSTCPRRAARRAVLIALAAAAAVALGPASGGASARFFAPASPWNAVLPADVPLAPDSAALVDDLVRQVDGLGPWINTDRFSTPVYTVGPGTRRIRVRLTRGDAAASVRAAFRSVPMPPSAKPASGSDGHAVIWQPSSDSMWEFWQLRGSGREWSASWGGRIRGVSRSVGVMPFPSGATATGLPLAGGLVTLADARRGRIDHALALALPEPRQAVFSPPANRTDGNADRGSAIPLGTRLRLAPDLNVAALRLPEITRMLAEAAQRYGIIVRDTSGSVTFYGEDPRGLRRNPWPALLRGDLMAKLRRFPWSRLQVVRSPRKCCWNVGNAAS